MTENHKFTVICPCCEATLTIDAATGALLAHSEKTRPTASFDDLQRDLTRQKQTRDDLFAQELNQQKNRERLLEDKFREAFKQAEQTGDQTPLRNPLDLD